MKKYKNFDVIYVAIKLCEKSQAMLLEMANEFLPKAVPGIMSSFKRSCEHITLAFGDNVSDSLLKLIGQTVVGLHPYMVIMDDVAGGLFFQKKEFELREIPWIGSTEESKPHVTLWHHVAVAPVAVGTLPSRNHTTLVADPTATLEGKISAFVKREDNQAFWI